MCHAGGYIAMQNPNLGNIISRNVVVIIDQDFHVRFLTSFLVFPMSEWVDENEQGRDQKSKEASGRGRERANVYIVSHIRLSRVARVNERKSKRASEKTKKQAKSFYF